MKRDWGRLSEAQQKLAGELFDKAKPSPRRSIVFGGIPKHPRPHSPEAQKHYDAAHEHMLLAKSIQSKTKNETLHGHQEED